MARYRKKPVVIEAWQFRLDKVDEPPWLHTALRNGNVYFQGGDDPYLTVETLEGRMRANVDDWIIRGVQGEIYPCKPDIFAATYEPAE